MATKSHKHPKLQKSHAEKRPKAEEDAKVIVKKINLQYMPENLLLKAKT